MEDMTMTELRRRMIEDMQLAGLAQGTQEVYIRAVRQLAAHFHLSPERISERQVRDYLIYRRDVRGIAKGTFQQQFFAIKFLYVNTLAYDWPLLTKKKFANPIANACPSFTATRTAAA
jgi:integrase/recombinase XerD